MNQATENLLLVLSAPGLYCLMVLLGRWLKRKKGVRLGWLYHLFSLALAVYLPASILEVNWAFMPHLAAATFLLGCVFLMALMDRYLWEWYFRDRNHVEVPKFLTEVARLAILIIAIFLVLEFGYHQSIRGLLVAPGIAVIIIGLAMQDSVGNIIAGLTLQMGRPFEHGDWLLVDSRHGDSMFILVEGEANVVVDRNGVQAHVASLASGDCFGEMSLLTGERAERDRGRQQRLRSGGDRQIDPGRQAQREPGIARQTQRDARTAAIGNGRNTGGARANQRPQSQTDRVPGLVSR
jgi:hypothetical protein